MAARTVRLLLLLVLILVDHSEERHLSDQKLCADQSCSVTISLAKAITDHKGEPGEDRLLKFKKGDIIRITSKSAGRRKDLWGGETDGRSGFFPRSFVMEDRVYFHNPTHTLPVEPSPKDEKFAVPDPDDDSDAIDNDDDDVDEEDDTDITDDLDIDDDTEVTTAEQETGPAEKDDSTKEKAKDEEKDASVADSEPSKTDVSASQREKSPEPSQPSDSVVEQTQNTMTPTEQKTGFTDKQQLGGKTAVADKVVEAVEGTAAKPKEASSLTGESESGKPSSDKPAEDKFVEGKDAEEEPTPGIPPGDKPIDEKQADEKSPAVKSVDENPTNGKLVDERPADKKAVHKRGKTVGRKSFPRKPPEKKPSVKKTAGKKLKAGKLADKEPSKKEPAEAKDPLTDRETEIKPPIVDETQDDPTDLDIAESDGSHPEEEEEKVPLHVMPGNGRVKSEPVRDEKLSQEDEQKKEDITRMDNHVPDGPAVIASSGNNPQDHLKITDERLRELRQHFVKRRLASVGQINSPDVQKTPISTATPDLGQDSTGEIKTSEQIEPALKDVKVTIAGSVSEAVPGRAHISQSSPSTFAYSTAPELPDEKTKGIKPEPPSSIPLESLTVKSKEILMTPSSAAVDRPTDVTQPQPKQPFSNSNIDDVTSVGDIQPTGTEVHAQGSHSFQHVHSISAAVDDSETTELSEDDLRSQKLLEELEKTMVPSYDSTFTSSPVTAKETLEPSHPSVQDSAKVQMTPGIVLPDGKTVLANEEGRQGSSIGSVVDAVQSVSVETEASSSAEPFQPSTPENMPQEAKDADAPVEDTSFQPEPPQTNTGDVTDTPEDEPLQEEFPPQPTEPAIPVTPPAVETESKATEETVGTTMSTITKFAEPYMNTLLDTLPDHFRLMLEKEPIGLPPAHTILFTIICLVVSFFFSIRCLCGKGDNAHAKLKERLQKVEYELFVTSKERDALTQSMQEAEDKAGTVGVKVSTFEETNKRLQIDVNNLQLHNSALKKSVLTLEEKVSSLTDDLDTVQANLSQKETELLDFQNQVYQLQEHSSNIEYQLQEAQAILVEKATTVEELEGSSQALQEQITQLQQSKQHLLKEAEDWHEKVEELKENVGILESQQKELQDSVSFKENEIEVLKDCFMQLKALESEESENDESGGDHSKIQEKVDAMVNVSRMNAILQQVEEEKITLQQKVLIETESRKEMEDQIKKIRQEMEMLKSSHSKAERESADAMMKLSVLSSYFKEKELQMQKELGEQLTLKKEKEGQLECVGEKAAEVEQEMSMYRSQVDDLKKEIVNIERDFRNQIAANEKKAHENWLSARAAERELKEAKGEAAMLRQKLTDLERRREFMGPEGLIRPLPTRGMPPPMMNGPLPPLPPPGERPTSRSSGVQPSPSPHMRDGELPSPNFDRMPPPPPLDRRPYLPPDRPMPPPGRLPMDRPLPPPMDRRPMPPPRMEMRSPPIDRISPPYERDPDRRYPPPPFTDRERRSPPSFTDRDRRSPPPYRPDMPPPPRMGPGGPPYPGPPLRGPPPPRREPFPPEPYPERRGPGRPMTSLHGERDRDNYGPPPPRERQQSFV